MNNRTKVAGAIITLTLIIPALAAAQTDSSSTVSAQVQSLLSQINTLEQQLRSLIQSATPSSTPMMWNASSTPPNMQGGASGGMAGGMNGGMGGCPNFSRDLSVGSQGSDVTQLQQMLQGDGFLSASTTGYFGQLTANALAQFQVHFGISTSSTGSFGPLTRAFIGSHCGQGQGNPMSSSTPPQMWQGSSTPPMPPMRPWMGTSTNPNWQGEMGSSTNPNWQGRQGSSTPPRPCPQNSPNAAQGAAAALFVPHVILPAMFLNPCGAPPSSSNQGSSNDSQ